MDLLGLMGDASDNIPGCPGVGEKTAVKLLTEYGSIENLIDNVESMKKSALKDKIQNNTEQIRLSKYLATIRTDVPVTFDEEASALKKPDYPKLVNIYKEMEFNFFLKKLAADGVIIEDMKEPLSTGNNSTKATIPKQTATAMDDDIQPAQKPLKDINCVEHTYEKICTTAQYETLAAELSRATSFAFDTETTGVDVHTAEIVGISFAITPHHAFYIPLPPNADETKNILAYFKEALENKTIEKCGHNAKFDIMMLAKYGIEVQGPLFDSMTAHYLIQPEMYHNMDFLAETLLNYKTIHIEELIGEKGKNQLNMRQVNVDKIVDYAAEDADITLQLCNVLKPQI